MESAERVSHLAAEGAYYMLARAQSVEAAGRHIIHLEIGQPDVPTFKNVSQTAIQRIRDAVAELDPLQDAQDPSLIP